MSIATRFTAAISAFRDPAGRYRPAPARNMDRPARGEFAFADPRRLFPGAQPYATYNPSFLVGQKGLQIFDEMRRDDQVKSALAFKKFACLSTGWKVQSPEGQPQDWEPTVFARWVLEHLDPHDIGAPTLDADLYEILSALDYGYCLAGFTPIATPSGSKPIESLAGMQPWVYAWDNGRLALRQATKVWKTGTREVVRVIYEWGRAGKGNVGEIVCTPDHPFLLLDGTYRKAGELKLRDRLMPFYRIEPKKSVTYPRIGLGWGGMIPEHRFVWEQVNGPVTDGHHIHHHDHDKTNNDPANLESLTGNDHIAHHAREWWECAPEIERAHRAAKIVDKRRGRSFAGPIEGTRRAWADPMKRALRIAAMREGKLINPPWSKTKHHSDEARAAISSAAVRRSRDAEGHFLSKNHRVLRVEPAGVADVFDMTVPGLHNFAANGVFVHNSVTEKIWAPIEGGPWDGYVGLRALKTRAPHAITFSQDEFGNLMPDGVLQQVNTTVPGGRLPRDKFVLFSYQSQFSNPYGTSDLEAAYTPWWIKYNGQKWLAMLLERFGIPPVFGLYDPRNYSGTGPGSATIDDLKKILQNLQAATSGVIPRYGKDSLEFWAPTELATNATRVFMPALEYFNKGIARSILMPDLLGMTQDSSQGSYARAKVHFDVFLLVVESIRKDLQTAIMCHQVMKPLLDLNFPGLDDYPTWSFMPLTDDLRLELLKQWAELVVDKVVMPQEDDEKHIRRLMQFPEKSPGTPEATGPITPAPAPPPPPPPSPTPPPPPPAAA